MAEKRRQARPAGADAAADKRRWLEEKAKRQQEELARTGLDEEKVRSPAEERLWRWHQPHQAGFPSLALLYRGLGWACSARAGLCLQTAHT